MWNDRLWEGVAPVNPILTKCGLPTCIPSGKGKFAFQIFGSNLYNPVLKIDT